MFRRQPALSSVCTLSSEPAWPEAELGKNKARANLSGPERHERPVPTWLLSLAPRGYSGAAPDRHRERSPRARSRAQTQSQTVPGSSS